MGWDRRDWTARRKGRGQGGAEVEEEQEVGSWRKWERGVRKRRRAGGEFDMGRVGGAGGSRCKACAAWGWKLYLKAVT